MDEDKVSISIDDARDEHIYRTDILKDFEGGKMTELQYTTFGKESRAVYKVEKGSTTVIFKTMSCLENDQEYINQAKEEYKLSLRGSELTDGVAKPIAYKEMHIKKVKQFLIEIVYEYCGQDLTTLIGKINAEEATEIMMRVAEIMAVLEADGIFHSDLKPANIAKQGNVVKIFDFGVAMKFQSTSEMMLTKTLMGGTKRYLPPEVLNTEKGHPGRVDVYSWGMTFYQLLTGKDNDILEDEIASRITNYTKFLDNIRSIKLKGTKNEKLKEWLINVLTKVLDVNNKKRPTFSELLSLIGGNNYYKEKFEKLQIKLRDMTKQRDDLEKLYEDLLIENTRLQKEFDDLNNVHNNCAAEIFKLNKILSEHNDKIKVMEYDAFLKEYSNEVKEAYNDIKLGKKCIRIHDRYIGDFGAHIMSNGLSHADKLNFIELSFCKIGVEGAEELAKGLSLCKTLREAYFGFGYYRDGGRTRTLCSSDYKHNAYLPLYLFMNKPIPINNSNQFKSEGAKAIAKWLKSSSLKSIDLSYCNISKDATDDIIDAVDSCETLESIYIDFNSEIEGIQHNFRGGLDV